MIPDTTSIDEIGNLQVLENSVIVCAGKVYEARVALFIAAESVIDAASALKRAELQATNSGAVTGSNETIRKAQLAEITTPESEALIVAQKNERKTRFEYDTVQNELDVLRYRLRIAELLYS